MTKEFHCNEVMPGCDYVAKGETEQEIMAQAAEHAREKHGLNEIDQETAAKVRSKIRTV